ncbi:MAG: hypothetical protein HW415_710 [Deltaproteobacteria bacterium]|nr:hypothetical protein [Deltaproteobacteria bacterium]
MKFTESAHLWQIVSAEIESQKVHRWGKMRSKNEESMDGICLLLQRQKTVYTILIPRNGLSQEIDYFVMSKCVIFCVY